MASSIGCALEQIKRELGQLIDERTVERACRESGHRWRRCVLPPLQTVHLLLLQLLAQVALTGLRHTASVSAQAIGKARQRLPLSVWLKLLEHSGTLACSQAGGQAAAAAAAGMWRGLRVLLADGMSVLVPDTKALRDRYGKGSNQHGASCSYPLPKLLALMDFGSGMIRRIIALPHCRGERTCLARLLDHVGVGDLLLGDRGLSSYAHLALIMQRGIACCIGLPRWLSVLGAGKGTHRRVKKLGEHDLLVKWIKPDRRPTWMSRRAWSALPAQLLLRQVNLRIRRPGFRDQWLRVITTLCDAESCPAKEIAQLYEKRWQVEVYFRDLKCTLKMKSLRSRSAAGLRKEIVAWVMLYNLVRQVMGRAATQQQVDPQRISFIDAVRWLLWCDADQPLPKLMVNPIRVRQAEPRVVKHGRRKYPLMNKPREVLRERLKQSGRVRRLS